MKPAKFSVFQLFERERRYVVPLYQRPYVWSREDQWEPLWQDILDKAVLIADPDESNTPYNHFLGAVVLSRIDTYGQEITADEIIDGQQRLTTLQIFLAALRDVAARTDEKKLVAGLRRLTDNDYASGLSHEQYKVWPTNADRDVFRSVMSAESVSEVRLRHPTRMDGKKALPHPRLVEAYLFFHEVIESFARRELADDGVGAAPSTGTILPERLNALYQALKHYLQLVVIELEADDDPQVIFETLNARGEPLLASDLIRNFAFMQAARKKANIDQLYDTYWRHFDEEPAELGSKGGERFWKQEERQGRLLRPRLDLFMFHYLTYQTERDIQIGHLFKEFKTWWSDKSETPEQGLKEIREHSKPFRGFFVPDDSSRPGLFARRLIALDTNTVYPVLLFLVMNEGGTVPYSELDGILTDLESFLVRRTVCNLTPKNYNRLFLGLLKKLRSMDTVSRQAVRSELLSGSGESVRWPDDRDFERAWLYSDVYQRLKAPRVGMILRAIERHRTTTKQENVSLQDQALEVEHILPRKYSPSDYPLTSPLLGEGAPEEERRARRETFLNTFGNLTLLTKPLNASVSNGSFSKKRPEIAKQSYLRLNTWLQDLSDHDTWNEDQILRRGRDLLATAKEIWPYPDNSPANTY